jgi:hypothetical protein
VLAVSKNTLKTVSAVVWLVGAAFLLSKAATLFAQAIALKPSETLSWLAVVAGVLIGGVKAKYLFGWFCRKNLERIDKLGDPQLWQAFRPVFYVFLAAMLLLSAALSRLAIGNYAGLIALVTLDISVGIALLGSMQPFLAREK